MKNWKHYLMVCLTALLVFTFISCDNNDNNSNNNDDEIVVSFEKFSTPSIIVRNSTQERLVAFKNTLTVDNLISGIPANDENHGLEKKESLFNTTGDFVLVLITEAEFNKNKSNLTAAPVFTMIYAFYNQEAENTNVYRISSFIGGDGQIIIKNPTSRNIIIKKDSPTGEILGFVALNSNNSIIKLQIPITYNLFPVFTKYNISTKEIIEMIPKYEKGTNIGKPYERTFNLSNSTPQNWDFTEIASSQDFSITSGGFFIKIENYSNVTVNLARNSEILSSSTGITYINPNSICQYFIPMNRNLNGTYPDTTTVSNLSIKAGQINISIPEQTYKRDYIYTFFITGLNAEGLVVGTIDLVPEVSIDLEALF